GRDAGAGHAQRPRGLSGHRLPALGLPSRHHPRRGDRRDDLRARRARPARRARRRAGLGAGVVDRARGERRARGRHPPRPRRGRPREPDARQPRPRHPARAHRGDLSMSGNPRFHLRVQRYGWDLASETYVSGWVPLLAPFAEMCVERLQLARGERVVDVRTRPGTAAFLAAERVGRDGAVVATDIADRMVRLAATRAAARGLPQMSFRRTDMETPVLDGSSFDAVTSVFGLMFAADTGAAVREMHRVLRSEEHTSELQSL